MNTTKKHRSTARFTAILQATVATLPVGTFAESPTEASRFLFAFYDRETYLEVRRRLRGSTRHFISEIHLNRNALKCFPHERSKLQSRLDFQSGQLYCLALMVAAAKRQAAFQYDLAHTVSMRATAPSPVRPKHYRARTKRQHQQWGYDAVMGQYRVINPEIERVRHSPMILPRLVPEILEPEPTAPTPATSPVLV